MNMFVIHSGADRDEVMEKVALLKRRNFKLNPLMLKNGNALWKIDARAKIRKAQMVVFFVGKNSHTSPYIAWELKQAHKYDKPIYTILLEESNTRHDALKYRDSFSGEEHFHDKLKTLDEVSLIISDYKAGDYHIFNQPVDKMDMSVLLEQYKTFLQTSEDLVSRRQNVNNFYISINSAIIAIFSALFAFELSHEVRMLIGMLFSLVGIVLSVAWIKMLVAYGNLNGSKMKIISSIEKHLPASLYDAEWAALSDKLNQKRYVSFTENEKRVPLIFIVIYSAILLLLLLSAILG
ncbi:MAG: TIR domain-containing protein [Clostridiales bacterium]|nr:TIR domain-containing protein [Clostridiales bacterium]